MFERRFKSYGLTEERIQTSKKTFKSALLKYLNKSNKITSFTPNFKFLSVNTWTLGFFQLQ